VVTKVLSGLEKRMKLIGYEKIGRTAILAFKAVIGHWKSYPMFYGA
jgi:hypothetical protein